MNDQQWEQLAADMGRLADAMEIIAKHLAPDAAKSLGHHKLPNLRRPLADYASFDWTTIGAKIVATDRSGPTEVEYRGVVCKRRSGEDKKGKAIWFNVVTGGTVAEGNITYERLISFRDGTPAEPLGDKVQSVMDKARQAASQPAAGPAWPAAEQPIPVAIAPTTPITKPIKLDPSLTEVYAAVHSEALKLFHTIPNQYLPESGDKPDDVKRKTAGLQDMIANKDTLPRTRTPEESAEYAKACKQHADLIQWAQQHQVTLPAHLHVQPADDAEHIGMKISTLTNLCAPSKAIAAGMRSDLDKAAQMRFDDAKADQKPAAGQTMTPAQVRIWIETRMKRYDASKKNNLQQRGLSIEAINAVTEQRAVQVIRALLSVEIDAMNSAQSMALYDYVKPARHHDGQILPANINAAAEMGAVLRESK